MFTSFYLDTIILTRILQNAISLVSLTLESCHASLSSVDCSMSAEVIDSMFSLIMSSAMTESLPGHEHVNIKSDPFDYLTYIRFSIASTLRRLKILMIIPLVQNSNTEECASTSVLIAKVIKINVVDIISSFPSLDI